MSTQTKRRRSKTRAASSNGVIDTVRVIEANHEPKLELRERLGMTREVFGRLVNVSVRAIAAMERNQAKVAKLERPYIEVARLYDALKDVVEPAAIGPWFISPNQVFGGMKPIELIERGQIDRLWDMVYRLQSGMPG